MRPDVTTPPPRRRDRVSPKRRPTEPTTTCSRRSVVPLESKRRLVDRAPPDTPASHAERVRFSSPPSHPAGPTGGESPQAKQVVARSRVNASAPTAGTEQRDSMVGSGTLHAERAGRGVHNATRQGIVLTGPGP